MQAIVVGGGFSGLALCLNLLERGFCVTLWEAKGIGEGASGSACGLLHPYAGEGVKRSFRADEALFEARRLLDVAQEYASGPVANFSGLIRQATPEQATVLRMHAVTYRDVKEIAPDSFLIESGIFIDAKNYLDGLFSACQAKGLQYEKRKMTSLDEISEDVYVFLALGAGILSFAQKEDWKLRPVRGQTLLCEWPSHLPPLVRPILGKGHVAPLADGVHLGSTYERGSIDETPCLATAIEDLQAKADILCPSIGKLIVKECKAGVRVTCQRHYFPLLTQIRQKAWVMTALGSRGLLYHAYAARLLVKEALAGTSLFNKSLLM